MTSKHAVTQLLIDWRSGSTNALEELTPLVYDELQRLARRYMQSERPGHTLQATGLVNEVFLQLADTDVDWQDRAHFFALAARMMRRILVDHARSKNSHKRGAGQNLETLIEGQVASAEDAPDDLLLLNDALTKLSEFDERKSDIVVLHYFGGMTYDETATALAVSAATVHRELRLAKAWLLNELQDH